MRLYNYLFKQKIITALKKQQCIFVPTDTVCGLLAKDEKVIYDIKVRDLSKKIILLVADANSIPNLSDVQRQFLETFWPGAVSVIKGGIAYRSPNIKPLLKILKTVGPCYCSSANISGKEVINDYKEAQTIFGDQIIYVTNKFKGSNCASTIVDIDSWKILREGEKTSEILNFINEIKNIN